MNLGHIVAEFQQIDFSQICHSPFELSHATLEMIQVQCLKKGLAETLFSPAVNTGTFLKNYLPRRVNHGTLVMTPRDLRLKSLAGMKSAQVRTLELNRVSNREVLGYEIAYSYPLNGATFTFSYDASGELVFLQLLAH